MPFTRTSHVVAGVAGAAVASIALLLGGAGAASQREVQPEGQPGEMDQAEMMEQWNQANQVGEHHKSMEPMVGTFKGQMTAQMPGMPEMSFPGTMTTRWIMNGKFLESTWESEFMGQKMVGKNITGYSTLNNTYQSIWYDDMGTSMYYAEGHRSADGKSYTYYGEETDPATGEPMKYMDVITVKDKDHHGFVRTYLTPEGPVKGFWINYTRVN